MFALEICGYAELKNVIEQFKPTHIISAIERIEKLPGKHLHVRVSDVSSSMEGYVLPSSNHLQKVLNFTRGLTDDDRLLVHCFAGQSRSTAYAIAVVIQHGAAFQEAFQKVAAVRSILLPNRQIARLTDRHFDLNGAYEQFVEEFHQASMRREWTPTSETVNKLNCLFRRMTETGS